MKKISLFSTLGASALVLSLLACESKKQDTASNDESIEIAEDANDSTFSERTEEKDADFVVNAVTSNLADIKILNELKAYADKKGIAIPLQESDKDAKEMNKLAEEPTEKFDEKWCDAMEDRHEKSINKFESRLDKTEDPELKDWIVATLPGLKEHLSMIESH